MKREKWRGGEARSPSPSGDGDRATRRRLHLCTDVEPIGVGLEPDELDGDARLRLGIAVGVYPDGDVIIGVLVPTDLTWRREVVLMVETHETEVLQSSVIGEGPEEDLIALKRVEIPDHILIPSKPRGHSGLGNAVPVKGVRPEATVQCVNAGAAHDRIVAVVANNHIVVGLAKEPITFAASVQRIVAVAAVDLISTAVSPHSILAAASENQIPAIAGMDVATFPRETRTQCLGVGRTVYFRKLRNVGKVRRPGFVKFRHDFLHLQAVGVVAKACVR
jgi:hypothetical protein